MITSRCIRCEAELPLSGFYKDKRLKNGIARQCKECHKRYARYKPDPAIKSLKCKHCKKTKKVDKFYPHKCNVTGYHSMCKPCYHIRHERYRERINRWFKDYRRKNWHIIYSYDSYLKQLLARDGWIDKEDITPELLALKKRQLKLHRLTYGSYESK